MGRIKKKGQAGNARNFITRNQAIRKLQIPLADFRKLCIWKGIFPREPRSRKKANKSATASTTFYYTKDIQYLLHEPLLQRFRDQKVLEKKISRALGRGDLSDAKRLESNANRPEKTGKPAYTLNHVIRERYPTFIDALRDLDDCLSMLFLFANLPSTDAVPAKMIARCERLCLEFQHYLIVSHSLRKSFLSIKGIYYQANIQGEDVLWVVPYKFNQRIVGDIDFRIMGTFVEFYMTLLGFVNYRLYTSFGLKYPPKFDQTKDDKAGELSAFTVESEKSLAAIEAPKEGGTEKPNPKVQEKVNELLKDMKEEEAAEMNERAVVAVTEGEEEEETIQAIDKFEPVAAGGDILHQPSYSSTNPGSLFANCTFFLSRETPRAPLEFILRSFGCKRIGWDEVLGTGAFTHDERDPRITHHVVDRPVIRAAMNEQGDGEDNQTSQKLPPNMRIPGRVYVQPQWVWDSINAEEQLPVNDYVPGATLPPHLSPFVKSAPGQYDPTIPLEEQEPEGEALQEEEDEEEYESDPDEEQEADDEPLAVKDVNVSMDMGVASSGNKHEADDDKDSFGGFSGEESDEDDSAMQQYKKELEAELQGKAVKDDRQDPKAKAKADARKKLAAKAREDAAELERRKGMMSKKKRKLYEKMEYSRSKEDSEARKLRAKRRKIEKQQGTKA